MRRLCIILLGILSVSSAVRAQETMRMSLNECMDYALKHNYNVKNARIDVLIQTIQNKETLSASYPHINGKAEFDDFYVPQSTFIDASTFAFPGSPAAPKGTIEALNFTLPYAASASVTTSQLLFDGAVFVAWKARNSVLEFARKNQEVTEENIRYNVYKSYNSLVIAYRQYSIISSSLSYARSLQHDLEITRQNGFAEKIDVERTDVQVNNLATDSIRIGNMLLISEDALKYQIGMDMNNKLVLTDTVVEQRKQAALDLLVQEKSYDRVPEYSALTSALTLNQYNLKRYQLAALPSLNAFWSYGSNYGSTRASDMFLFNRYSPSSVIGIQLNVPIYNGSLRHYQVQEAKMNIEKSENNLANMKLTIDFQVSQSRTTLKNAILQAQSQHRNMDLADDVLDLAQKKYKAGVGSNLEVTQAQTDQLRAQTNYFSALLDITNAEADLKKALGLLK